MNERGKKTWKIVAGFHLALIIFFVLVENIHDREPEVLQVSLVAPASPRKSAESATPDTETETAETEPAEETAEPAPVPPEPAPPEPAPPEPTPPEPAPQRTVQTERPAPAPQEEWKPRSAEEVRRTALRKVTSGSSRNVNTSTLKQRLRRKVGGITTSVSTPSSSASSQADVSTYVQAVQNLLYRKWEQPAQSGVSGKPSVRVELIIASSGAIIKGRILQASGSLAMDRSVVRLLKEVRSLPSFDRYNLKQSRLELTIRFELD